MNALPANDWTFVVKINACSVAPRAGLETAFFPQILKHANQERNEENSECLCHLVTYNMYHTIFLDRFFKIQPLNITNQFIFLTLVLGWIPL